MSVLTHQALDRLHACGLLSQLDLHFAGFLAARAGDPGPELMLAAALASNHTREGHICLNLAGIAGKPLGCDKDGRAPLVCPELDDWLEGLRRSPVVGQPGEYKPLVLDARARLYLHRYWDYQEKLARAVKERTVDVSDGVDLSWLRGGLSRYFPSAKPRETDWQKVAAFTALTKRFCVISGGPGTGKTTTAAKFLALLLEQAGSEKLRIALAAPTGKAAVRLQEAMGRVKSVLTCPEDVKEALPEKGATIHRLLRPIPASPYFRHNQENPLPVDVLVVDEASMVDLALMCKLTQALPPKAQLILLGDKDQLASVEAGAVLGDICDTGNAHAFSKGLCETLQRVAGERIPQQLCGQPEPGLGDCIVHLHESYRFGGDSGIAAVSRAVRQGNGAEATALLREGGYRDIVWRDLPRADLLPGILRDNILRGFADCLRLSDPREVFQELDTFRILCALREGPFGVGAVNTLAERILAKQRLIHPDQRWYRGRPVMIASNDYKLGLFNGDVGIMLPDPESGNDLRAFFPADAGGLKRFHPLRLPDHETVYAMTVHKSQGSEFDRLLLILPDRDSPVLTRELIYTGITRARKKVEIWGREEIFRTAVSRSTQRLSGLRDLLWQHSGPPFLQ